MERVPQSRNGRPSRLTEEIRATMRGWIAVQPDLTLAELQQRLREQFQLSVSLGQMRRSPSTGPLRFRLLTR